MSKPFRRFFSITSYIEYFAQINKTPSILSLTGVFLGALTKRNIKENLGMMRRAYYVNRLPAFPSFNLSKNLPKIELLIVVEEKDFELLEYTIRNFLKFSLNPVKRLVLVVPEDQIKNCKNVIDMIKPKIEFEILSEDDVVKESVRKILKLEFGNRYGWILQQFITVAYLLEYKENVDEPVVALDADTLIQNYTSWIDDKKRQILLPSIERHQPYYDLIKKLPKDILVKNRTFISHHMVYLPSRFRQIFEEIGFKEVNALVEFVIQNYDRSVNSPICVEFEIYAQYLCKFMPECRELLKFSNVSVNRKDYLETIQKSNFKGVSFYRNFKSISLHSYL